MHELVMMQLHKGSEKNVKLTWEFRSDIRFIIIACTSDFGGIVILDWVYCGDGNSYFKLIPMTPFQFIFTFVLLTNIHLWTQDAHHSKV